MRGSARLIYGAGVTAVVLVLAVLLAGCGGSTDSAGPTGEATEATPTTTAPVTTTPATIEPETTESATTTPEPASASGRDLYVQAGCGSCHGNLAQGTPIGPALPGHSETVVIRQVRTPIDSMPAYAPAKISDADLGAIAAYIASLPVPEKHVEPVKLPDVIATHHWMALTSIEAGDLKDALHHVNHVIASVKATHLAAMKKARTALKAGKKHEAEHLIQEMLADRKKPKATLTSLHLGLALEAVKKGDVNEAKHQTRHYIALAASHDKSHGQEVLELLKAGKLAAAKGEIGHLLG